MAVGVWDSGGGVVGKEILLGHCKIITFFSLIEYDQPRQMEFVMVIIMIDVT